MKSRFLLLSIFGEFLSSEISSLCKMPQKGNVLDKVVQFTALQMFARDTEKNLANGNFI